MSQTNHNDDTLFDRPVFDRLVDGELSVTQRQQLLASLDNRQDGWRDCALAFLESQTWGHQFKQLTTSTTYSTGSQAPAWEPTAQQALPALQEAEPQLQRVPRREPGDEGTTTPAKLGQWLAIAASLLLAFSFGWLTKSPTSSSPQQEKVVTIEREELPLRDEPTDSEDAITLLVRDTEGNNRRLQVPLMDVESIDQQFGAALPDNLKARFRDHGFDLQRRRRFAPMFFEQDEQLVPMVVPVDDTYLVPVSRPVY